MKFINPSLIGAFATGAITATATFGPVCLKLDGSCEVTNRNEHPSCWQSTEMGMGIAKTTANGGMKSASMNQDQIVNQNEKLWNEEPAGEKRDDASSAGEERTGLRDSAR